MKQFTLQLLTRRTWIPQQFRVQRMLWWGTRRWSQTCGGNRSRDTCPGEETATLLTSRSTDVSAVIRQHFLGFKDMVTNSQFHRIFHQKFQVHKVIHTGDVNTDDVRYVGKMENFRWRKNVLEILWPWLFETMQRWIRIILKQTNSTSTKYYISRCYQRTSTWTCKFYSTHFSQLLRLRSLILAFIGCPVFATTGWCVRTYTIGSALCCLQSQKAQK